MTMKVRTNLLYEFVSLHVRLCSIIKQEGQAMILNKKIDNKYLWLMVVSLIYS
jgi:hypothetical protein